MTNEDEELLKKCIQDWKSGKLTDFKAMVIVSNIVMPQPVTGDDIEWGKSKLQEMWDNGLGNSN